MSSRRRVFQQEFKKKEESEESHLETDMEGED